MVIRKRIADNNAGTPDRPIWAHSRLQDHSLLVEIFFYEGDEEAAWREARAGGCSEGLWLELAKRREKFHPEDAVGIYKAHVARLLRNTGQRVAPYRRARVALWHECKDVDLAVWLAHLRDLDGLRRAKDRDLRELQAASGIGVASHHVDVFVLEPGTDRFWAGSVGSPAAPRARESVSCRTAAPQDSYNSIWTFIGGRSLWQRTASSTCSIARPAGSPAFPSCRCRLANTSLAVILPPDGHGLSTLQLISAVPEQIRAADVDCVNIRQRRRGVHHARTIDVLHCSYPSELKTNFGGFFGLIAKAC